MIDRKLMLGGRRELAYSEIGDLDWPCVFFFHGGPSSRLQLAYYQQGLAAARLRVITPDRPGYGGSSPQPGRSMADWPSDVAALADMLGIERFVVVGHSSGGPYAVACAALLPERVRAGVVLAGVTDFGWAGAQEGYPQSELELMRMPDESAAIAWCEQRFGADGSGFLDATDFEFAEADNAFFADGQAGQALLSNLGEAFRQGVVGYAQDIWVQGQPWPFDPVGIDVPFQIAHGECDVLVPLAHSRHTSELIRRSRLHVLPGHGHVTILSELSALVCGLGEVR